MPAHLAVDILRSIALIALGAVVSSYSTVVGGGAIILLPIFSLMGLPLLVAIATMRLVSSLSQSVGVVAFARKGAIQWKPALWGALFAIPGAYFGAKLVLRLNPHVLSHVIAVCMILILIGAFRFNKNSLANRPENQWFYWLMAIFCVVLGVYGGFYGVAFSTVVMVLFISLGGQDLLTASGSASVVTVAMSLAATYPFLHARVVDWKVFWPVVIGATIGAWLGVDIASRYGFSWIRGLMVVVLVGSVAKLLIWP